MKYVHRSVTLPIAPVLALATLVLTADLPAQTPQQASSVASAKPATPAAPPQRIQAVSQTIGREIPLVIAHRGASGYLPEHTQESAVFAHALGADYIEQDVVMSKDGVPVVMHDVTLNSITNVADVFPGRDEDGKFFVFNFTWAELQKLTVHERESAGRFPADSGNFRIATFEQHVQLIQGLNKSRDRNAGLYVEIKKPGLHHSRGLNSSAAVLKILQKYGYADPDARVFLQCFEAAEVVRIRMELKSRLQIIQLFSRTPTDSQLAETAKYANGIGVKISSVVSDAKNGKATLTDLVKAAHQQLLLVHVWTLRDDALPKFTDTPEELISYLVKDGGVDGIFTDHPDTLLAWRIKMNRQGRLKGPFHLLNSD